MAGKDISLKTQEGTFNYRVGAIIINGDSVLMAKNSGSPHYYSVGGRVRFGESLHESVKREAYEETKLLLELDRLAYIHENFFLWGLEQIPFHEVAFFYLFKPSGQIAGQSFDNLCEEYGQVFLRWLPISQLDDFHIYPEFFKTELGILQNGSSKDVRHFVTKEGVTCRLL